MSEISHYTKIAPESGGHPNQLVVLVHGYGSNADDLINLSPELANYVPQAQFVSPDAPFLLDNDNSGVARQWFSLLDRSEDKLIQGLSTATPILQRFIEARLKELGLSWRNTVLLGFSQGAMLSLHMALRQPKEQSVAGVLCYSGTMVAPHLLAAEQKSSPPCLCVHGEDDEIVPPINMAFTAKVLSRVGIDVQTILRPGLMHGIDLPGLRAGGEFLQKLQEKSNKVSSKGREV
mgnify:CR=1 FL=1